MRKVVIEISQGSVVTQTVLGGLTIYLPVANFLCFTYAKNYENWLRVDKVIAMNTVCSFLAHPVYSEIPAMTIYVNKIIHVIVSTMPPLSSCHLTCNLRKQC